MEAFLKARQNKSKARVDGMVLFMMAAMALAVGCSMMLRVVGGQPQDSYETSAYNTLRAPLPRPAAHQVRVVTRD